MSEMVDRIAKVIYDAEAASIAASFPDMCKEMARAAIAAMREPTDAMVNAGRDMYPPDQDCIPVWETMIDEALR